MIHKQFLDNERGPICRVTFVLPESIWADHIYLVGEFNQWNSTSHPMRQTLQGQWTITLDLPAGPAYEFRYLCDGEWLNDNQADGYVPNPHGAHNFIVRTDPAGSQLSRSGQQES